MHNSIIFTLFESNYYYGVGALINSAVRCDFKGRFIIGFKSKLPFWINQLTKKSSFYLIPNYENIEIEFTEIKSDLHLRYYKAFLFKELLEKYPLHKLFYFDPDITIIGDWDFFERWVENGVGLVLNDCYPIMPYNHPLKHEWAKIYNYDVEKGDLFNFYVNSGFMGGNENLTNIITQWKFNILKLVKNGYDLSSHKCPVEKTHSYKRLNPITGDQDILNATIIENYGTTKFSIMGPEGMGFTQGGYVMLHNTGSKTWNKNFILDFMKNGVKITEANYSYIENSSFPINLYPNTFNRFLLKVNLLITQILQRVF